MSVVVLRELRPKHGFLVTALAAGASGACSIVALCKPVFRRVPVAGVAMRYGWRSVEGVSYGDCSGGVDEDCARLRAAGYTWGALETAAAVLLLASALGVLAQWWRQDRGHLLRPAAFAAFTGSALSFLAAALWPPLFAPYTDFCTYGGDGYCEYASGYWAAPFASTLALLAGVVIMSNMDTMGASLVLQTDVGSGAVYHTLERPARSASCLMQCGLWATVIVLFVAMPLSALAYTTLGYQPDGADLTDAEAAALACPAGSGFLDAPQWAGDGDVCAFAPLYYTCCADAGCDGRDLYDGVIEDPSEECAALVDSLSRAPCHYEAASFTADFDVSAGGAQPVTVCDYFCGQLYAACGGVGVRDAWCEDTFELPAVQSTLFTDACFSAGGRAGWSLLPLVVVSVLVVV